MAYDAAIPQTTRAEATGSGASMPWPRAAASAAIFRGGDVLLVKRGKTHMAGRWSLPGGHIAPGERACEAALRELMEETGIRARLIDLADVHDVLVHAGDGTLQAHYVIAVYAGRWCAGEPVAASDATEAQFVPIGELSRFAMTPGAADIIGRASAIAAEGAVRSAGRGRGA